MCGVQAFAALSQQFSAFRIPHSELGRFVGIGLSTCFARGAFYNVPMFLHREHDPSGVLLIPQASHAWLAWQLADHWGNRRFARPAPRSEVLAAVFLHDCGWTEFDAEPGIDDDGRPVTFDRMPVSEHLGIWRQSVSRAASYSRYAALLVAAHFTTLVEAKTTRLLNRDDTAGARAAQSFRAEMERLQASWRESLSLDARYQPYLDGMAWRANSQLVDACDRASVFFCSSIESVFRVGAVSPSGDLEEIEFDGSSGTGWRVHPWPLEGDRLRLHCEGRRLPRAAFSSAEELHEALVRAPIERLTFTLHRPSAG